MLPAKFLNGIPGEGGHLLAELPEVGDLMVEAPGYANGLTRLDHVLELDAWDPFEFLPCPESGKVEKHPDR